MRPLALTAPFALAACLSLTGCTIYTYSSTPQQQQRPAKAKPASTAQRNPVLVKPGRRTPGVSPTTSDPTPTVTGTTIFGGPAKAAFRGNAFVIPEGTRTMPTFDDLVPFGILYTDQLDVSPQVFSGGFPGALQQDEWFAIRYTGAIAIPTSGKVTFKLVSDDGAILYVDGKKVIDNDGVHTAKTVTGDVTLDAGRHELQLDYFQEKRGSVALQLFTVVGGRDLPVVGMR